MDTKFFLDVFVCIERPRHYARGPCEESDLGHGHYLIKRPPPKEANDGVIIERNLDDVSV